MDMAKRMQITLAWELFEQSVPKAHIAKHLEPVMNFFRAGIGV